MFAARGQGSSRSSHATSGGPLASTSAAGYAAEVSLAPRSGKYPHRLNLYERPPTDEVTLEEFEIWAIDRLRRESPATLPPFSLAPGTPDRLAVRDES
jgi:DNA primase large subunit